MIHLHRHRDEPLAPVLTWLAFIILAALFVSAIGGCSLFPEPKTPKQKAALCYATVSALSNTTKTRETENRITTTQAGEIIELIDQANSICKIGEVAATGENPEDAVAYLDAAILVLDKVEGILNARR